MTYFCSSFPGSPSSQAIEAATSITGVFPHLSELTLKIGVQFAIHRTDQSKLFPVNVLLQYARPSYPSHWAISGCFVQIRTASVVQAAEHVLREFNPSSSNQRTGPALPVKLCSMDLNRSSKSLALRLGRIDWMPARCELLAALVLGESRDTGRVVGYYRPIL